ncbi:MAG: PQQ-binding-like beta-propeller repeat protein [Candidatus Methanofastidiosia archaeon]|jgi:outer membrane protein assembly factor BamB
MNEATKNLNGVYLSQHVNRKIVISGFVLALVNLSYVSPYSIEPPYNISHVEIYYYAEMFGPQPVVSHTYKLKKAGSVYISDTGKRISPYLVEQLLSSLTDLYESDEYENTYDEYRRTCYYPHYKVTITLLDGTQIILESHSNYHCWIPWNITYNNKTYVQYNGKIPSALLKLHTALIDMPEDFFVEYGCFPAPVPQRYKEKGISPDFPASTYVVTPEKLASISHVQWKMDTESSIVVSSLFIGGKAVVLTRETVTVVHPGTGGLIWRNHCGKITSKPVYENGTLFISTTEKVMALKFKTGEIKWQTRMPEQLHTSRGYLHETLLYDTMLFVSVKGGVYCFNRYTGELIWEHCEEGPYYADLYIIEDNLIVRGAGVRVFNANTGALLWEIMGDYYTKIRSCTITGDDRILIRTEHLIDGFYWNFVHTDTGNILWKSRLYNAVYLQYHNKMLYYSNPVYERIVCLDTESMKEIWSYPYTDSIGGIKIIGDTIAFLEYIEKDHIEWVTRLVFLDFDGHLIWQHTYAEGERYWSSSILNIPFYDDTLFFIRGNTIKAVNKNTGEHIWLTEVMGPYITSFDIHYNTIYVTSDDSRLYCIDMETGGIKWYYELEKEIFYSEWHTVTDPEFNNNFIAVATYRGDIFMFSHYASSSPLEPQENGVYIE